MPTSTPPERNLPLSVTGVKHHRYHTLWSDGRVHWQVLGVVVDSLLTTGRGFVCIFPQDQPRPVLQSAMLDETPQSERWDAWRSQRKQRGDQAGTWGHITRSPGRTFMFSLTQLDAMVLPTPSPTRLLLSFSWLFCPTLQLAPTPPNTMLCLFNVRESYQGKPR